LVGKAQNAEPPSKDILFRRDQTVEPSNGGLCKARKRPIRNGHIQGPGAEDGSHPANQYVLVQIEKEERRARLAENSGGKWKLDDENFAKHAVAYR
jgi:hypothetical protein